MQMQVDLLMLSLMAKLSLRCWWCGWILGLSHWVSHLREPSWFLHNCKDMTFHLLRSAHFLKADSTGWAGYEFPDELEAVAASGLYADKSQTDRLVVDLSLCFRRFDQIPVWHGILSWIYLVTPYTAATFNGLQFFVARPLGDEIDAEISDPSSPSPSPTSRTFEIISVQLGIVQTRRETGRAKPPNGTHDFEGRNRFDTQAAYRAYQLIQYSAALLDRAEFVFCMFSARYGTILFFLHLGIFITFLCLALATLSVEQQQVWNNHTVI